MRYKQLAIYPVALTLLGLALWACGPADESVQREIGNLPSAAPQAEEATATPVPTNTPVPAPSLVPVERCITLNSEAVELVDEEYREQGEDGVWRQCDMYWPEPTPDPTLQAKQVPAMPAVQQHRYLKELEAMEEAGGASGESDEPIYSPYGIHAEADPTVNLKFYYESDAETTAACEWLLGQLGETMETTEIGCSLDYQVVSGRIPASLVEGMVDQPGYLYSSPGTEFYSP